MIERIKAAWLGFLHPEFLEIQDPLTGALTWKKFLLIANRIVNRFKKDEGDISLLFLDADGLKTVNDMQGHLAGDLFIQKFSRAILTNIRPLDLCGRRHGENGDEFILLLPGIHPGNAERVAKRIQEVFPNFSWGATSLKNERDTLKFMVDRAEGLMYVQKKQKALMYVQREQKAILNI